MRLLFTIILLSFSQPLAAAEKMMNQPKIYRGTKSVAGEFLSVGFIQNCTGTAVGKSVVFTASHCVTTGKRIKYDSRFDGKSYYAICDRHPRYNDRTVYNDWALCKLEAGSEFPSDMPLASFEAKTPANGELLLLNGYGAPNFSVHHWGNENMTRVNGQDLTVCGDVVLGGGDSGGSLFLDTKDRSGKSGFKIVGVNSRAGGGCSYFNRISHEEFGAFAKDYEKQKGVKLCGVSATCNGSVPPPPPPQPTNCWQVYEEFAFCLGTKSLPGCLLKADLLKNCVR
jgi:hypothetical protein